MFQTWLREPTLVMEVSMLNNREKNSLDHLFLYLSKKCNDASTSVDLACNTIAATLSTEEMRIPYVKVRWSDFVN